MGEEELRYCTECYRLYSLESFENPSPVQGHCDHCGNCNWDELRPWDGVPIPGPLELSGKRHDWPYSQHVTTNGTADTPEADGYGGAVVGVKYDAEKTRYDLVHWPFIEEVAEVLTLGAAKYSDDNWKAVREGPNGRGRYIAAAFRHFIAWIGGEKDDPESGKSHLAHMACCLMFLAWEKGE